MSKDTFYFSHDYNSRSDEKIKKLIRKHNMLGYGIFWAIVEDLYQNNNSLELDYDLLSYEYRVDVSVIQSIIKDFGLFSYDDKYFGSISVSKRIDARNEKSKTASENAYKRWGKLESREKAVNCIFYVIRIYNQDEEFVKCGITTESISRRFSGKLNGYEYEVLYSIQLSVEDAISLENEIENNFDKHEPKIKFAGNLECYNILNINNIVKTAMQRECKGNAIKESKGKEIKVKEIKVNNISERKLEFASTLEMYLPIYGRDFLNDFYFYWTEPNNSNTKFRKELQKTWSLERRLETWAKNDSKFKNNGKPHEKSKTEQIIENSYKAQPIIEDYFKNRNNG